MVSKDYLDGYEEATKEFLHVVESAIKRYNGAKTVQDCIKALNDIIVASHQLRTSTQKKVVQEDEVDEMEAAIKMMFPNATFVKFIGGEEK